jgi:hypothetical protein
MDKPQPGMEAYRLKPQCLQMLQLAAEDPQIFPSDQTLRIHAVSVPKQDFVPGSYFGLVIGEYARFHWSVDDAILRACAMQQADAFVEQIVQQRHRYDAPSLLMLSRQLRAIQTAHMIPIEPTIVVPPRQQLALFVWSGTPKRGQERSTYWLGDRLGDSKLYARLACSWVRDVA